MQGRAQTALTHSKLSAQVAQRDPMQVMFHGQMGQELVAEEPFGKDSRRSSRESAVTAPTVKLLQFITNDLLAHRIHFNNGTGFSALGVHGAAAVGASLRPRHRLLACDRIVGNVVTTVAAVPGLGAAPTVRAFRRRVGFEGDFG